MNKLRRKRIAELTERIQAVQADMEVLLEILGTIRDDEQEAFDNIPESLEGSERYEAAEAAVDALDYAYDNLEAAKDGLDDVTSDLDTAVE